MPRPRRFLLPSLAMCIAGFLGSFGSTSLAQAEPGTNPVATSQPSTQPGKGLPHVQVDIKARQVRVDCEALRVEAPLEFLCVANGTNEHESLLRSRAKASDIHLALLMLGLKPGEPVKYSEAAKKWFPPHGPPLNISLEFRKDGKPVSGPANRFMRDVKTKGAMPPTTWIFAGSRLTEDGTYAADVTGYHVSIVNFDLSLIDIPELASSANDTLEWQSDLDALPAFGTPVTMIIEPTGGGDPSPATRPSADGTADGAGTAAAAAGQTPEANADPKRSNLSDVGIDAMKVDRLHKAWEDKVAPHAKALQEAAQTHYEVLTSLRREQQRLIDEADRIQRVIDELDKQYQQLTTPRPEPIGKPAMP